MILLLACQIEPTTEQVDAAIVATTLATDYTTGTLSAVDPADRVHDHLATVHSDAVVRAVDDRLYVVNRLLMDTVRRYEPGVWEAPTWEVSTGEASNPQDVAMCGGSLFVSRYEETSLLVLDPSDGSRQAEVDLSDHADDDGVPEMADLVVLPDDRLAVGLQRLRRLDGWRAEAEGRVAIINCESMLIEHFFPTPANPVLRAGRRSGGVRVLTADGVVEVDERGSPLGDPWLPPAGLPVDGAVGAGGAIIVVRDGSRHAVWCESSDDQHFLVDDGERYISSVTMDDAGVAWLAERPGWEEPDAPAGITRVHLSDCARHAEDGLLRTELPPFSLAALPTR